MTSLEDVRLDARSLTFSYKTPLISGFSLTLTAGCLTGVIGPNGCGKTTVLRLLDGILHPQSGEVLLDGKRSLRTLSRKEIARHIAMVPQSPGNYEYQTVIQFAMHGRSPHLSSLGFETAQDEAIVRAALDATQLADYLERPVSNISGGERQRLLLARALAQQTRILLLDEFTANLDINYQVELTRLVARITRERSLATLVVSHEINLLAAFCDRIVLMTNGTIRHQGKIADVITQENLSEVFGIDFSVRPRANGAVEVLPILGQNSRKEGGASAKNCEGCTTDD